MSTLAIFTLNHKIFFPKIYFKNFAFTLLWILQIKLYNIHNDWYLTKFIYLFFVSIIAIIAILYASSGIPYGLGVC